MNIVRFPGAIFLLVVTAMLCLPSTAALGFPNRVVYTLSVGEKPSMLVVADDGRYAYVTNTGDGTISRIDLYRFAPDGELEVGTEPIGLILSSSENLLYVANSLDSTVSVIETADFTVSSHFASGLFPLGLALSSDGEEIFVAARNEDTLAAYKTSDFTLREAVALGEGALPFGLSITPDGDSLVVSSEGFGTGAVIDVKEFTLTGSAVVGASPRGLVLDSAGEFAYFALAGEDAVAKMKLSDATFVDAVTVGNQPYAVALDPDNEFLFVTNQLDDSVDVVRLSDFSLELGDVAVGDEPKGLALSPGGRYLLVVNSGDGTVSVLTDGPQVTVQDAVPEAINNGKNNETTITWTSDSAGSYQIEVGGTGTKGSGETVRTGTMEAGGTVSEILTSEDFTSGDQDYYVFVYVDPANTELTGRMATKVYLDTVAPSTPENLRAEPGDGLLRLRWDSASDSGSGIGGYRVAYGTVSGQLENQVDTGNVTVYDLKGLENGVTYYATVSALDKALNQSEPGGEVSQVPEAVPGAIPSGGGCFIDTTARGRMWGLMLILIIVALVAGIRGKGPKAGRIAAILLLAWTAVCGSAYALDDYGITGIMLGVKGGYYKPTQGRVEDTYGDGGLATSFTVTWVNRTNFETTVGAGFKHLTAEALTASGRKSGQDSTLWIAPAEFTIRYRFDYLENQLLVPYVDGGVQGLYYREDIDNREDNVDGFTVGYHGSLGLRLLLNRFSPEDAHTLYKATGVKESFLVMEGRYEIIDRFGSEDFDLSGLVLAMGFELKF